MAQSGTSAAKRILLERQDIATRMCTKTWYSERELNILPTANPQKKANGQ